MMIKTLLYTLVIQSRSIRDFMRKKLIHRSHPPVSRNPAFDPETDEWFRKRIRSTQCYLEYGAGASTLLAADALVPTISIESDSKYAQSVRDALPAANKTQIVHVDIGITVDWGYPLWTLKTNRAVKRWKAYPNAGPAEIITSDQFPDLVLVDGRFRVACCLSVVVSAIEHNKQTQILFDDYSLRPQYSVVEEVLGMPEMIGRARVFNIEPSKISLAATHALLDAAYSDFT